VAYAHSRKVIHRDLKPQNVVLGDFGEVVVLDWGLAKLVDRPEHSEPLPSVAPGKDDGRDPTLQGQVLGTPAYMAPEQAEGRLDRVDHRSDIYGLGPILYEILTGGPPFGGSDTRAVLRRVIHKDPARPRDRVPATPRALEAVCLRALAKSPEGRYGTAAELAGEVRRYLAGEPVAAYPEPAAARAGRWVRRHRTAVAVAVALLLTATTGLAVGTALLGRANAEARRQRDLADANFAKARQAVDDYFTAVSESTLLKSPLPGLQPLRKQLLESALRYYEGFVQRDRDDARLRARLAGAAYRAGKIRADVGGGRDAALESLRMARRLYEGLLRSEPRSPVYRHELARVEFEMGKALFFNGRRTEAIEATRAAGALERELAREDPAPLEYRRQLAYAENNLGVMFQETGRPPEEIDHFRRAIAAWSELARAEPASAEDRRGLSLSQNNLGVNLHMGGRWPEARAAYEEAIDLLRGLLRLEPSNATYQNDLARALGNFGNLLGQAGQSKAASWTLQEALSISQDAARRNPTVSVLQDDRAEVGNLLGELQVATGQVDAGLCSFREVLGIIGRALGDNPDFAARIGPRAMVSHLGIGRALSRRGETSEARASLRMAVELGAKHAGQDPERLCHLARAQALYSAVVVQGKAEPTPAERAESDRSGASAVETLRRAVDAGYRNLPWIRRDPDLDPLRPRHDFKELIAVLEGEPAAAK
jgi:eukaryotic-like serine/threonine-protein kinase